MSVQRVRYHKNELSCEQIKALGDLGFVWCVYDKAWTSKYDSYLKYINESGSTQVPKGLFFEGFNLSKWASKQREAYSSGVLKPHRKRLLDNVNFDWKPATGIHSKHSQNINLRTQKTKKNTKIALPKAPWEK